VIPPLVLHAEGQQLRAQYLYHDLAVEYVEPGSHGLLDSILVPLDALAEIEGRDDSPVVVEAAEPDKTEIRWQDHGILQSRVYAVTPFGKIAPFPETPTTLRDFSGDVLVALEEASRICTHETNRYALDCIQFRGTVHKIVASDGHQLRVRSGSGFPWDGDLFVKGSPVFACKTLPGDRPIRIGRTDTQVLLRVGPWTTFHEIQMEARFPQVEEALPEQGAGTTLLRLEPEDARFLESALARLPGSEEPNNTATLDLNGRVAIRASDPVSSLITELVLNRSSYTGPKVRVNTNRAFLRKAMQFAFSELGISSAEAPIVCREPHRIYAWRPLNGDTALEPGDNVVRIESSPAASSAGSNQTTPETPRRTMRTPIQHNGHESAVPVNGNGHTVTDSPGTSLAVLIQDAESLHAILTDARTSIARLIAGLRRYRKQSRLLSETLKSLRQLKLTEAVE
jgi:hypothetical protein